uniref:hypothetical protein n=1 Tax=Microcoleus sp. TaxID=44472 RepID=UPI00403E4173
VCPMPYALCPMPYALCPMPYARRVPHVTEKGYIIDIFSPGRIGPVKPGLIDSNARARILGKKPGFEESECIQD